MSSPILIIDPPEPKLPKKDKVITIYKQAVYDDVDANSYKYAEARPEMAPQQGNAVASDTAERMDGHIVARNVGFRDAQLRKLITFALKDDAPVATANDQMVLEDSFVYNLELFSDFKDAMVQPLAEHIHRYLVWGALFDWYGASLGDRQYQFYEKQLKDLENAIVDFIVGPQVCQRPLQPFGPAQKMIVK